MKGSGLGAQHYEVPGIGSTFADKTVGKNKAFLGVPIGNQLISAMIFTRKWNWLVNTYK